jgi:uncharacterized glyoxalase superfamily protein PhnB
MKVLVLWMAIAAAVGPLKGQSQQERKSMTITRVTPVLAVPEVEPCVKFWVERMGFKVTSEVPDGKTVGFATLERDGVELMYQSYHSIENDNAAIAALARKGSSFLYVEVNDLDDVIAAMKGAEIAMPLRTTFYGMKELGVKDPAGHVITFAQKAGEAKQ